MIRVWGRDGRPRGTIPTAGPVTALVFRPDGTLVAGDAAGTITVWDVAARKPVRTLRGNSGGVTSIAVDPAGKFAVSGGRDHSVQLTDLTGAAAPRLLPAGHAGPVNAVAFDRTGQFVASGGADGRIALWDVGRDRPLGTLVDGRSAVKTLAFSPRDPLLAAGDAAGDIVLWSTERRAEVGRVRSRGAVRSVAISADGTTLAAAGSDSLVYLWEVATGRPVAALTGHTGPANAVAFAPGDGQVLASSGPDPRIVLWTLKPDDVIARICAQTPGASCP
jgi:WD40 repeat protein